MSHKRSTKNTSSGGHIHRKVARHSKPSAKGALAKVLPFKKILGLVRETKDRGLTIATTNGCFDILHVGHIRFLEEAKRHGDILIVGINSDASVRSFKGPSRPMNTERERALVVAALQSVDAVFIFNETRPTKWLSRVLPHVHVKGADRTMDEIFEKDVVEKGGGKIILTDLVGGKSTTNVIDNIRASQ